MSITAILTPCPFTPDAWRPSTPLAEISWPVTAAGTCRSGVSTETTPPLEDNLSMTPAGARTWHEVSKAHLDPSSELPGLGRDGGRVAGLGADDHDLPLDGHSGHPRGRKEHEQREGARGGTSPARRSKPGSGHYREMADRARLVGINHVALEVGDLDEALEFYGRIFDIEVESRIPGMAFVSMGDQFLALAEGRTQKRDDDRHLGLVVDDRRPRWPRRARRASSSSGGATTSAIRGAISSRSSSTRRSSSPRLPRCSKV